MSIKTPRNKPAGDNVPRKAASPAHAPKSLAYTTREGFIWLKKAELIEKTTGSEVVEDLADAETQDACKVRRSMNKALMILLHFTKGELSTYRLAQMKKSGEEIPIGGLPLDYSSLALQIVTGTGSIEHRVVVGAIESANLRHDSKFFLDLGKALSLKGRPPKIKQKDIESFLVLNWCGFPNRIKYGALMQALSDGQIDKWTGKVASGYKNNQPIFVLPPLCLFSGGALARFCTLLLGIGHEDASADKIRQLVSRLGLDQASTPKITDFREDSCGRIYFICDRS